MTTEAEREREARTLDGQPGLASTRTQADPRHVEVATANTAVLPENLARRGMSFVNDDAAHSIYLGLGATAALARDIVLLPAGSWDGRVGERLWLGEVNAIAAATANLLVVEV